MSVVARISSLWLVSRPLHLAVAAAEQLLLANESHSTQKHVGDDAATAALALCVRLISRKVGGRVARRVQLLQRLLHLLRGVVGADWVLAA